MYGRSGIGLQASLHDSLAAYAPRGAEWPAPPRMPRYDTRRGAPPLVAAGVDLYDAAPGVGPADLQPGWTPSTWATTGDPASYALGGVNRAVHTYAPQGDGLYAYKRLDRDAARAAEWDAANASAADGGLNPYAATTPYLREFHAWAAVQAADLAAHGIQETVRADRMPGLSVVLARSHPLALHTDWYGPPPTPLPPGNSAASPWATSASTEAMRRRGALPPLTTLRGPTARGTVGSRGSVGSYASYGRADWAAPQADTTNVGQVFN